MPAPLRPGQVVYVRARVVSEDVAFGTPVVIVETVGSDKKGTGSWQYVEPDTVITAAELLRSVK